MIALHVNERTKMVDNNSFFVVKLSKFRLLETSRSGGNGESNPDMRVVACTCTAILTSR